MARLRVYLLGPPRVELDGRPVHIGRRKVLALLAYLVVAKKRHSRETLAAFLAPDFDHVDARTDLRRTLSLLNSLLGPGWLAADRETVGLHRDTDPSASFAQHPEGSARTGQALWLDVDRFRQGLATCQTHGHPLAEACPDCVQPLKEAVALHQGDFMAGFSLPDSLPFDEWQRFEAEALDQELASAQERLVQALSTQGDDEAVIPYARRWLELNLTHEPAHCTLMELYARTGQTSAALHQYQYCVQTLAEELGVPPSAETRALYERIRAGLATESDGVAPVQDQQIPEVPHNLLPQPTPFIGRVAELEKLDTLIAAPDVRLITIVGPGGMGKTRLALAAAERQLTQPTDSRITEAMNPRAHPFPDGVYFVPLAPLNSPDQIASTLADAIGFRFEGGSIRTPEQQLLRFLRDKQMLLVLDNYEHLLALPFRPSTEGETGGAGLASEILHTAHQVTILATSRERLQLREEQVFTIQGLHYLVDADSDALAGIVDTAAARLFLHSAGRARHDFALAADDVPSLARICRLVGGMPLALELSSSWVDTLSLTKIADEVGRGLDLLEAEWQDVPRRHRSVRAALDASWRHLGPVEREVFAQLSVFRGGFTREAARAVVDTGTGEPLSYRVLARLVSKSLLHYGQNRDRYAVHELLRQYGEEKLIDQKSDVSETSDFLAVRDRHSAYYCAALERWAKDLHGARQGAALDEIEMDLENIRDAWGCAVAWKDVAVLDQAMEGYWYFYWRKTTGHESIAQFQLAIDALGQVDETSADFADAQRVLVRATIHQAHLFRALGMRTLSKTSLWHAETLLDSPVLLGHDTRRERALLYHRMGLAERALPLYRSLGDRASEGWCLFKLGLLEEGLAVHKAVENHQGVAYALYYLARSAYRQGDFEQAKHLLVDSLASYRAGHSPTGSFALAALADVHRESGDDDNARQLYKVCLESARNQGKFHACVRALYGLGALALLNYDTNEARQRFKDSLVLADEHGGREFSAPVLAALGQVALFLGEYDVCLDHMRQSLSIFRECGHADAAASDLGSLGAAHWLSAAFDAADAAIKEGLAIAREEQQLRIADILTLLQCQVMMCVGRYTQVAARAEDVLALVRDESEQPLLFQDFGDLAFPYRYTPPRCRKTGVLGWTHGVLGWVALAQGDYCKAQQSLEQGIAALRTAGDREYEAWALAGLGATALAQGDRAEAHGHLRDALKTVVEIRAYMPLLHLMPIISLLWADADEPNMKERAMEIYALAERHPLIANSKLFDDIAGQHIKVATAHLPSEVVEAAQVRGRELHWWETAERLLVELREKGWGKESDP